MKFKFERTKKGVLFVRGKKCYFVKFCDSKSCFGCELDELHACYHLYNDALFLKKMRF